MPPGKIGRSCHPSREREGSQVTPSREEEQGRARNAWRQNSGSVMHRNLQPRVAAAALVCCILEAVKKRI